MAKQTMQYVGAFLSGCALSLLSWMGISPSNAIAAELPVLQWPQQGALTATVDASQLSQDFANISFLIADASSGKPNMIETDSGLKYEDLVEGTGATAEKGNKVEVHYVGTLENGSKFDSSRDRNQTFEFPLGAGRVIKGWDEGVAGMKVGGKRKLVIPSKLGYGSRGIGPIPPDATLIFEVELVGIK